MARTKPEETRRKRRFQKRRRENRERLREVKAQPDHPTDTPKP